MKKKNIKKWILGLCSAFILTLVVGFSLPKTDAKALSSAEYNIYGYEWANYLDSNSSVVYEPAHTFTSSWGVFFSSVNYGKNINSFGLVVDDTSFFEPHKTYSFSIGLYMFRYGDNRQPLSNLIPNNYSFNVKMSNSGDSRVSLVPYDTYLFVGTYASENDDGDYTSRRGYSFHMNDYSYWDGWYSDWNYIELYFRIRNADLLNVGDVLSFSEFQLNAGTDLYTYSNYFYSLWEIPDPLPSKVISSSGGSTPDVPDVPEVDGSYQEGYLAGLAQSQYGFLVTNNIYLVITYTDGYVARYKIEPTRIFGGLDFTNVYNDYVPNINDTVSFSRLEFYFSPFVRPSALILYGEGPAYFFNSNMVVNPAVSGNSNPVLNWHVSSDNSTLYETTLVRGENLGAWQAVSLFSANYTSFDFLKGLRLFVTDSNLYENGYLVGSGEGYNKGYYEGLEANQQEIYDKAYDEGHRIGYDDGFVVGSRANNSFLGLFTAVIDAPVLTFTSMLDFDILGYNMKSIVLSLLSIALVVAIIRLFSKGGSAV